ncbi:uncharacterized protein F4822DRAFT_205223 [Hypoxylon trugodes]|uniref:uncharacterized protein n=1 Tax=Hypoxylon trugodes TaxID=326681 RepID=UPI002191641D|nr:uncharacterized protein F4822DRAFT_205223 [Hypoxylon trugodes]KAI1389570.1 hypothetical protein F4822DRAFT_205223 [Hypoxylon trugodes]
MYLPKAMFSLPSSLLLLLAAATKVRAQHPTAIRKMSLDEGEKIFPEFYAFGPQPLHHRASDDDMLLSSNSSAAIPFQPPYPLHYDYRDTELRSANIRAGTNKGETDKKQEDTGLLLYRRAREVLSKLQGRQFACPAGTHSCTNIDQPNYCCTDGTSCFVVTNAPDAGNVGCCPNGQNCGVTVGTCADGSTACPANVGGGCCIPGFVCASVGCVASSISIITQTTLTSTAISIPTPSTQVVTVIVTVTPSGGGAPVTSTTTQTTTANAPTSTSSSTPTSTTAPDTNSGGVPPYRPTSGSSASYCPTGFYACVASAGGGCCRTGRDCSTTSCPPAASTTIVSIGATIVVPVSDADAAGSATGTATCAAGWFLCGGDAGPVAGCCPNGYACGTASCTLSAATATATVQKELPNGGPRARGGMLAHGAVVMLGAGLFAAIMA